MAREQLYEYPTLVDPFLDFEATRQHFGTASCNYALSEAKINNRTVVYLSQQREGQEVISTPIGFKRVCEQGIVICGYKFSRFLRNPKIIIIPESEREAVKSELMKIIAKEKASYFDFWD